jgi:hypothetical protein
MSAVVTLSRLDVLLGFARLRPLFPYEFDEILQEAAGAGRNLVVELLEMQTGSSRLNLVEVYRRMGPQRRPSHPSSYRGRHLQHYTPIGSIDMLDHAIEQFRARHCEGLTPEEAEAFMRSEVEGARRVSSPRDRGAFVSPGQELRVTPSAIRLVIGYGGRGARPVCVTVLPARPVAPRRMGKPVGGGRGR